MWYIPRMVATKAEAGDIREFPAAALKSRASKLSWLRAILRSTFSSCRMASLKFCLQQQLNQLRPLHLNAHVLLMHVAAALECSFAAQDVEADLMAGNLADQKDCQQSCKPPDLPDSIPQSLPATASHPAQLCRLEQSHSPRTGAAGLSYSSVTVQITKIRFFFLPHQIIALQVVMQRHSAVLPHWQHSL